MGVTFVLYKLLAFFAAGFFAGIAGSFYISALFFVSPEHYEWFYSLLWVGIILIGGVGSIQGLVFGSAFVVLIFKALEIMVLGVSNSYGVLSKFGVDHYKIHFLRRFGVQSGDYFLPNLQIQWIEL